MGCKVLELSKLATYKFYCDFLKQKCENVKLYRHNILDNILYKLYR